MLHGQDDAAADAGGRRTVRRRGCGHVGTHEPGFDRLGGVCGKSGDSHTNQCIWPTGKFDLLTVTWAAPAPAVRPATFHIRVENVRHVREFASIHPDLQVTS
jgi:hypothetical protein